MHKNKNWQSGKHKDNKNLFKSKKTTYNKRLATEIVADWELKVVVINISPNRSFCAFTLAFLS